MKTNALLAGFAVVLAGTVAAIAEEQKPAASAGGASGGPRDTAALVDTLFERLDTNFDGKLSREEFRAIETMLGSLESGTTAYPSNGGVPAKPATPPAAADSKAAPAK